MQRRGCTRLHAAEQVSRSKPGLKRLADFDAREGALRHRHRPFRCAPGIKRKFDGDGLSSGEQRTLDRELVELQLQPARLPEIGGEGLDPGFISLPPLSSRALPEGRMRWWGRCGGTADGLELAPFLDGDDKIRPHSLDLVPLSTRTGRARGATA